MIGTEMRLLISVTCAKPSEKVSVAWSSWAAVFGPKGMPRDIVERLNKEFGAAGSKPEVLSTFEKQSFQHVHSSPEQLAALVKDQYQVYRDTLKAAGVEPE